MSMFKLERYKLEHFFEDRILSELSAIKIKLKKYLISTTHNETVFQIKFGINRFI